MTIPFLDLFKKLSSRFNRVAAETQVSTQPPPSPIRQKKPETERLSKTVMPNSTRSFSTSDPFRAAASTTATSRSSIPLELGANKTTSSATRPRGGQLPPALARALEPKLERTISLRVADFMDAVPAGFIKPVEILDERVRLVEGLGDRKRNAGQTSDDFPAQSLPTGPGDFSRERASR